MIEQISPEFGTALAGAEDIRLKVLWVEDRQPKHVAKDPDVIELFNVWLARTPADIGENLPRARKSVTAGLEAELLYSFPSFPFDAYLADFSLNQAPKDSASRLAAEERADTEDAPDPEWADMASKAKGAEAAGLTSSVLTALNFDRHPAVIVPYTGNPEDQIGGQRALIRMLTAESLVLAEEAVIRDFNKADFRVVLGQFTRTYRDSLPVWIETGLLIPRYIELDGVPSRFEFDKEHDADRASDSLIVSFRQGCMKLPSDNC